MKKMVVVYEGWGERWPLGTLADDGRRLLFEYSPEALRQGLELSPRHLALRAGTFADFPQHQMRLPGLVADALPDGWGLLLMDRLFRQQGREPSTLSPLDRLAFIHDRAIGACTFEPPASAALSSEDLQLLDLARQARVIVSGRESDALVRLALTGGSPQGARPKVLVHSDVGEGRVSTCAFPGSTPWLVKFQARHEHREVCAIELLYADLARGCGLDMPATRHFDLGKTLAGFGIERFDIDAGLRVPVHTLAGLLHADFRLPSSVDYVTFLRATRFLTRSQVEVDKAYERAVFNVVFNNRDDHARNVSYRLGRDRRWRLAPAYDLTFSTGVQGEHQMDVCGVARDIGRVHLLELARLGGVSPNVANRTLERILTTAGTVTERARQLPIRSTTLKSIRSTIEVHRARLS